MFAVVGVLETEPSLRDAQQSALSAIVSGSAVAGPCEGLLE